MTIEPKVATPTQGNYDIDPEELYADDTERKMSEDLYQPNDMVKLVKTYIEESIPEEHKKHPLYSEFWAVYGKTLILSFLEKDDLYQFQILLDNAILDFMMTKPRYEVKFSDRVIVDQMRIYFLAALNRAVGSKSHKFNERIILGGQINQIVRTNSEAINTGDNRGGGAISRFFGKL